MEDFSSNDVARGSIASVDTGFMRGFGAARVAEVTSDADEATDGDAETGDAVSVVDAAKPLDVATMLKNSRYQSSPEALEDSRRLDEMCVMFFDKFQIPVNTQVPILFLASLNGEPLLVMKGLLVNDAIMAAFRKIPDVQVLKSPPKFFGTPVFDEDGNLDLTKMEVGPRMMEFQMPVAFFESVVCGEVGNVVAETSSRAERVIEV